MKHLLYLFLFSTLIAFSCDDPGSPDARYTSQWVNLPNGSAYAFTYVDVDGEPAEVGVDMTATALENLPDANSPQPFVIKFPGGGHVVPFDHVSLDWVAHGTTEAYGAPHFKVHFYLDDETKLSRIEAGDVNQFNKEPDLQYLPAGFKSDYKGVAGEGITWWDPTAPEHNSQPLTQAFVWGSFDGEVNFLAPIVALDYLKTKPNAEFPIKQPASYQTPGYYPTTLAIRYNAEKQLYSIVLKDLVKR